MSNDYKTNNNIECDCECTLETALYYAQCVTPEERDAATPDVNLKFVVSKSPQALPEGIITTSVKDSFKLIGKAAADRIMDAVTEKATQTVTDAFSKINSRVDSIVDVIKPPGGSSNSDPRALGYRGQQRLCYDPKPVEVRLNTGLKPNTYTSLYEDGVSNFSSPLHLSLVKVQFPEDSSRLDKYFAKIVAFVFTNAIQQAVSFNIDTTTVLTPANIRKTFNAIATALNVYFFFNSILSFETNPQNRNVGMADLRSSLTASDLNDLLYLKKKLMGTPIPPRFINFFMYLNQTYVASNLPNTPLLKLCPVDFVTSTNRPDSLQIYASLEALDDAVVKSVLTQMSKAAPSWLGQNIPDVAWSPIYDPNFMTIWSNLPYENYDGTTIRRGPTISSETVPFKYLTWTNNLDGAAFPLCSAYNTANSAWLPTMLKPGKCTFTNNKYTNRLYFTNGGNFADSCENIAHTMQRLETFVMCTNYIGNIASVHYAGSQMCEQVTPAALMETGLSLIDHLASIDTIGIVEDKRHYIGSITGRATAYESRDKARPRNKKNQGGDKKKKKQQDNNKSEDSSTT